MGDFGPDWYINTVELVTSLTQVGKYLSGLEWSLSICNILRTVSTKLIWVLEEGPRYLQKAVKNQNLSIPSVGRWNRALQFVSIQL